MIIMAVCHLYGGWVGVDLFFHPPWTANTHCLGNLSWTNGCVWVGAKAVKIEQLGVEMLLWAVTSPLSPFGTTSMLSSLVGRRIPLLTPTAHQPTSQSA